MNATRLVAMIALATATTAATANTPRAVANVCSEVLESEVCTWAVTEGQKVVEVGAEIPLSLIESVPRDAEMVWPPQPLASVPLPDEAKAALGIDHMEINWEAHGHPPTAFLTRHFDFHFYNIPQGDVRGIDCADESKPSELPAGYALPDIEVPELGKLVGLCVPQMGMHAMPQADIAATDPFDASMILGYYGARPVFFEPMVSQDLLLKHSDFTLPMPGVDDLPAGVRYPSEFHAEYDENHDRYRLIFSGFEQARAAPGDLSEGR